MAAYRLPAVAWKWTCLREVRSGVVCVSCVLWCVYVYCDSDSVYVSRCMNSLTIVPDAIIQSVERLKAWGSKEHGHAKAVNLNWYGTNPTLFLFRGVILHLVRRRVL